MLWLKKEALKAESRAASVEKTMRKLPVAGWGWMSGGGGVVCVSGGWGLVGREAGRREEPRPSRNGGDGGLRGCRRQSVQPRGQFAVTGTASIAGHGGPDWVAGGVSGRLQEGLGGPGSES